MRQALSLVRAVAFLATCAASINADEPEAKPITIPLNEIWAYQMPGARDVFELEPPVSGPKAQSVPVEEIQRRNRESRVQKILRFLGPPTFTATVDVPGPGFAVLRTGKEALRHAYDVFAKREEPRNVFLVGDEITAVFFSYSARSYVHIHEVKRRGHTIEIRFRRVPHLTEETTKHFALIPLGKLPVGEYRVEMMNVPLGEEFADWPVKPTTKEWIRQFLCQPFSFSVKERGRNYTPSGKD